jgi:hypothetical protein
MASKDPWEALSVGEVASLLDGLPVRWWIAGGQAVDLFVGSSTRPHQDVDVAVLRRNPVVRLPLDRLGRTTATGLPYLRPEVVLLYKAKRPRAPDEHDAAVAIPRLSGSERAWLAAAVAKDRPDHHWLPLLAHQERA